MMRSLVSLSAILLSGIFVVSASGAEEWTRTDAVPAWVRKPESRKGYLRIVHAGRSNLLHLAYGSTERAQPYVVQRPIALRLRALLGADADKVAAACVTPAAFVKKAYTVDPARPGKERTLGGSQTIAWVLWEVDVGPILAAVPADKREAAAKALHRTEPATYPAWVDTTGVPAWVAAPPPRKGHLVMVIRERARRSDVARTNSRLFAEIQVGANVMRPLRKLLGPKQAWAVGHTAATWRMLAARASHTAEGGETTAWVHWQVPLAPILAAVPAEYRERARALLEAAPVKQK